MKTFLKTFIADETGASAAEYALIIAVVGVGVGAAALFLGANVTRAIEGAGSDVYECSVDSTATNAGGATNGTKSC
ncbi:Flp family type IVb pilin [Aurantiacibacter hainanensis]|uniref:Flp family type IVb pilin n=1 Tax=Aurantiacibacter hainanensis TaxID=3076114 RepID=UPI0030C728C1